MNKNKRFNKKEAVRFVLVPGRDQNGNPTTMFKPVQTRTKLTQRERSKIITQISDYQIQIDGKPVNQSDLPSFVLEQIKGRADLVFNQNNPDLAFKQQQDGQEQMVEMMEEDEQWDFEGQEIPQEEYMNAESLSIVKDGNDAEVKQKQEQEEQLKQVDVDGKKYKVTKSQLKMLQQVLPQNYENLKIQGVEFVKYDENGSRIDQKQSYQKYIAEPKERRGIIDSFDFVPDKLVDTVDNDLEGEVLKGDMKEVEEALNYEGEEGAYEQLQDDFFQQLMGNTKENKDDKAKKSKQIQKQSFKKKSATQTPIISVAKQQQIKKQKQQKVQKVQKKAQQPKVSKLDQLDGDDEDYEEEQYDDDQDYEDEDYDDQQITDQMLDKALEQYNRTGESNQNQEQQIQRIPGTGVPSGTKGTQLIKFIQSRQQCIGKDGQLDWRTLTKKQKKQYMKNKKIRSIFEQVREKQIQQKLRGVQNVKPQDLHLKKYIQHIPYNEDHVMQEAIERDLKQVVNIQADIQNDQDFETDSEQDDIISYRAKTSVISSNLATVEQLGQKRKKKKHQQQGQNSQQKASNIQKLKVVPQRRNRNETKQERKQRKQKLKQQKKQRKQQRQQFNVMFQEERKRVMKRQNNTTNNTLHKVPYVKIV